MYKDLDRGEIGRMAENMALKYLEARGLILRDRNWRIRHLELDLIMEDSERLHIIEVRSRREPINIEPYETVDFKKQRFLIKAASSYVYKKKIYKDVVFDIVSVIFKEKDFEIDYIEEAFLPIMK